MHVPLMSKILVALSEAIMRARTYESKGSVAKVSRQAANRGHTAKMVGKRRTKNRLATESRRINWRRAA